MATKYENEEEANLSVEIIREFIDVEKQFILNEHDLEGKLYSLDNILAHIDELAQEREAEFHNLTQEISMAILSIREHLESGRLRGLKIQTEEESNITKLKQDILNGEWAASKVVIQNEEKEEEATIRLGIDELKILHAGFNKLVQIMKSSKIIPLATDNPIKKKRKMDFKAREDYYLHEIYMLMSFYEKLFQNLIKKENMLRSKLKQRKIR